MKFILPILLFLSFAAAGDVIACDLSQIKFGSSYNEIKNQNNIHYEFDDAALPQYFEMQTRARNFCAEIDGRVEATLTFISGSLSKIVFQNFTDELTLKPFVTKTFGEVEQQTIANKNGNDKQLNWRKNGLTITYTQRDNVKPREGEAPNSWALETLNITLDSATEKLVEYSTKLEE
jgi:hypothetical protein